MGRSDWERRRPRPQEKVTITRNFLDALSGAGADTKCQARFFKPTKPTKPTKADSTPSSQFYQALKHSF